VLQPVYALAAALAFQALLCAQNIKDPTGIRSNIYLIVAGRSASGKERGRAVIKEIITKLENSPERKGFYSPKDFIMEETASYPALVRHLEANHGALLWLWDEMGVVFPSLNTDRTSYLSGIIPIIMRLYSSADSIFLPHARAGKNETLPTIQQPNLVLYGTSVKEKLFNAFSVDTLTDGFIGRLMIFEGDDSAKRRKLHVIPQVPDGIIETTDWWLKKRAANINQAIPQPSLVPVTAEAEEIFDRFYQIHEEIQTENSNIKDALWGRSTQQARQFALIYATSVNRDNPVIDANAAQWAYELVTYLIKRKIYIARRHVADSDFDKKQKEMLRYIETCKGKCTPTMLCRKFRNLKKRERDEIIDNLLTTKALKIEHIQKKHSRQTSAVYAINKK
jgi:hypothetical protein